MLKHFPNLPGLPWSRRSSDQNIQYIPLGSPYLGQTRRSGLSSFSLRKAAWLVATGFFLIAVCLTAAGRVRPTIHFGNSHSSDHDGPIPLGQSVDRGGREVFWWEQFPRLIGYYRGLNDVVLPSAYVPEQQQIDVPFAPLPSTEPTLQLVANSQYDQIQCSITPPKIQAYDGLPQGMTSPLLGSMEEMGIDHTIC